MPWPYGIYSSTACTTARLSAYFPLCPLRMVPQCNVHAGMFVAARAYMAMRKQHDGDSPHTGSCQRCHSLFTAWHSMQGEAYLQDGVTHECSIATCGLITNGCFCILQVLRRGWASRFVVTLCSQFPVPLCILLALLHGMKRLLCLQGSTCARQGPHACCMLWLELLQSAAEVVHIHLPPQYVCTCTSGWPGLLWRARGELVRVGFCQKGSRVTV